MSVRDRWHLARPEPGARKCGKHKKVPSAEHEQGLRWQTVGTDDRGHVVKFNFDAKDEAEDKDAELKAAVRAGKYVDERAGKVTLRSRCELWLEGRDHDPVTRERVERMFRNHVYEDPATPGVTPRGGMAIGEMSVLLLSRQPSRIAGWLTRTPLHPNTKILLYDLVSSVFKAAVADHIIHENPFSSPAVVKPGRKDTDVVAWPPEVVAAVAAQLHPRAEAMPLLAAACGQRQGEAFAVAVPDLDMLRQTCRIQVQLKLVGGQLVFGPIKNDRPRVVPLPGYTRDVLAEHLRLFPAVPVALPWLKEDHTLGRPVTRLLVFTRPDGQPWTRSAFNPRWVRAWHAAGVEDAGQVNGFHVCRHSCAAAWLSGGLSVAKVGHMLGDSVAVVSKTYAHFLPSDEDRARVIMNEHFKALSGRDIALTTPSRVAR